MHRYRLCLIGILLCFSISSFGQEQKKQKSKKKSFYIFWGYNRSYYSKTNLHFNGPNYDFTLYNLKAKDRPSKIGLVYINAETITVPQYNFRLGYFLSDRISISLGIDHMKYVVTPNQEAIISGIITSNASTTYAGTYLNQSIYLDKDLLEFEHTDGFNLVTLDLEYLQPVKSFKNTKISTFWNFGIGGIWVATKTDVKVLQDGLDNDFHIAGYSLVGKTGPRIEYNNRFFILGEIKGGYATLPSVLVKNSAPELGDHNLSFLEFYIAIGFNFKIGNKEKLHQLNEQNYFKLR